MTTSISTRMSASNEQLRNLTDFDSALALAGDLGGTVAKSDILGDGFTLHAGGKNKDDFVGVPLMFVSWSFSPGDYGDGSEFCTMRVLRRDGNETSKWILNDGSTGIAAQLRSLAETDVQVLYSARGLRKSEYTAMVPDSKTGELKPTPSVTYYIDTSATR